jgi:hypothetical protein
VAVTEDFKIYADGAGPATLNDGAGKLTDYATLQEAVLAWLSAGYSLPRQIEWTARHWLNPIPRSRHAHLVFHRLLLDQPGHDLANAGQGREIHGRVHR